MDKLTEFLRSFVSSHLGRFDGHDRFPVLEFLSLMFKYTFLQPRVEAFTACLDAWATVIDYVTNSLANNRGCGKDLGGSPRGGGSSGLRLLARYQEAFLALTVEVLARMQFRIDHPSRSMLQDLDNSTLDDDVRIQYCAR